MALYLRTVKLPPSRFLLLLFFAALPLFVPGCKNGPFSSDPAEFRSAELVQPNDPLYPNQWYLEMIDAPGAWRIATDRELLGATRTVKVAVIDSLFDTAHEDLRGVMSDDGYNFVTDEPIAVPGVTPDEDDKHGTHVAGLVGAEGGNGVGVVGAAYVGAGDGPVAMMPVVVLARDENGATQGSLADLAEGILYAAGIPRSGRPQPSSPARIITMSLGASALVAAEEVFLHEVIRLAADADVLMIAASGNRGWAPVDFPARFPEVIAVGALDSRGQRATFSNYGEALELMAPGVSLVSTIPADQYDALSGTSMATPLVAGVAAMIRFVNPGLTAGQVREILRSTAADLGDAGRDQLYGFGMVNAREAMSRAIDYRPDSVVRGRSLRKTDDDTAPGTRTITPVWDDSGSRTIVVLLDEEYYTARGMTLHEAAREIAELTGVVPQESGRMLRAVVPAGADGQSIVAVLADLPGVSSVAQDRLLTWR